MNTKITDETLVVSYANKLGLFNFVNFDRDETAEQCLARAVQFSKEGAEQCRRNLDSILAGSKDPKQIEYWKERIASYEDDKPIVEKWGDYKKRERAELLKGDPKEITEKRWWEMFEVLPPCGLVMNSRYTMFYISEAYSGLYHDCYLWDKTTGKYWSKMCDISDRSTFLDSILGLRAA